MTVVNIATGEVVEVDAAAAERRAERINLRLGAIADNLKAVLPMIREAIEKRDDIALGYRSPGEYVADRFGQALGGLGIEVRRAVVGELTAAGLSTRAIAPVVGVSNKTVHQDIAAVTEVTPAPTPRPVTGIDGKTYTRPAAPDHRAIASEAVTEFPDLAYYFNLGQFVDVVNMARDLRRYREQGELDDRLDNLRRSIAVDRARRDGSYRPGTTAVMGDDGEYRMQPLPAASTPHPEMCPTCGQTVRN